MVRRGIVSSPNSCDPIDHTVEIHDLPLPAEAREALLTGEQFLHGALFELALLGEELLQGFDEGIRIAQRLGDGFLFGFGGREGDWKRRVFSPVNPRLPAAHGIDCDPVPIWAAVYKVREKRG